MPTSVEKEFTYKFKVKGCESTLRVPISIPLDQTVKDFVGRLFRYHKLPCFIKKDLTQALQIFVNQEQQALHEGNAENSVKALQDGSVNIDDLVEKWKTVYTQEVKEYSRPELVSNEQVFSEVYHTLIHSPALETLLNLEHTYALAVDDIISQRDRDLAHLAERQSEEMEETMKLLGSIYNDAQVNQLAQRQFESSQMITSKWDSELSNQQETQKREYREWVMKVHEDTQTTTGTPNFVQRVRALTNSMPKYDGAEDSVQSNQPKMEESFTIHLGAQLKTMHNLRILCTDVLDLCRHKPNRIGGMLIPSPQRLQTAMSLYSNHLCALVLLVDNRLSCYSGIKREFAKVCEQSTDFHFPNLEQQFRKIELEVIKGNEWRATHKINEEGDKISIKSTSSSESQREDRMTRMQVGDFYITKHSNLSDVHLVFHLVRDETLNAPDLSSRNAIILGLRNILKVCFRYDVFTLSIPLLLTHEMSELSPLFSGRSLGPTELERKIYYFYASSHFDFTRYLY